MSHKLVALAIPLAVLLVGSGAALAFAPADAPDVEATTIHHRPVAETPAAPEPAPEAPADAPVDAAPAETRDAPEPIVFEDIVLREFGQVSPSYHQTWSWNVESTQFRGFGIDLNLGQSDPGWIAYCVQAILRDGAGNEVAQSSGAAWGNDDVFDWTYAEGIDGITWLGEWTLELHVQGSVLTDYAVNVDVLY